MVSVGSHAVSISGQGTWESTLHARDLDGNGSTDAYYDTALGVTWLADPEYVVTSGQADFGRVTWTDAMAWVDGLTLGGYDDWRLPSTIDTGSIGCDHSYGGTDCGYRPDSASSELSHMFYVTLGNQGVDGHAGSPATGTEGIGLTNSGYFDNLQQGVHWSGSAYVEPEFHWGFSTYNGLQGVFHPQYFPVAYAWAVRSGDVIAAPVPEPETYFMMLAGLAFVCASRKLPRKRA